MEPGGRYCNVLHRVSQLEPTWTYAHRDWNTVFLALNQLFKRMSFIDEQPAFAGLSVQLAVLSALAVRIMSLLTRLISSWRCSSEEFSEHLKILCALIVGRQNREIS